MKSFFSDLYPDNTFEIFIDLALINKGSILEDMDRPVACPRETQEPEYSTNAALVDGFQTSNLKLEHERYADFLIHNSYLYTTNLRDEL